MLRILTLTSIALILLVSAPFAAAHCQIPCGIYSDEMRFDMIEEHVKTIEKSMNEITRLSAETPANYNQLARWVSNKEQHAQAVQDIVHQYFLTQRVKAKDPADEAAYTGYVTHVTLLHQMLVAAMKCKQTTDLGHANRLRELNAACREHYFSTHVP